MARPRTKAAEETHEDEKGEVSNVQASKKGKYVVSRPFSDNPTIQPDRALANRYQVGDDVSDMDPKRLESLVSKGYVKHS